ncbi:MAG: serine hydrolase [Candidatus Aminicenantes bacterium]|nr:serine hydrolase [Candidatus Aminicenantes bacterium]
MKNHRIPLALILFAAVIAAPLLSAPKEARKPDLKGFSEQVSKLIAEWKVPGLAVSIVKDGKVIFAEGFGRRDVEKNLKVTPHTLFAIGSCSKAFTATAMGILVDEGKVEWDKPVRTYLPTFKLHDTVASERMTLRDLLTHRSGLPGHEFVWYGSTASRKELFDRLQYLEPNKDFRAVWQYQNLMFMTAGYLVGEAAGTGWEAFVQKRLFDPLEMKESNMSVTESQKTADFALPYQEKEDKVVPIPFRNIDTIGPAGSINSNVLDMANWVLMNLNKGKFKDKPIISEAALAEIHTPQAMMPSSIQYDEVLYTSYGMGWAIVPYRGRLLLEHGGGIDGFIAMVAFLPRENMGAVILSNSGSTPLPSILVYNIIDRVLGLSPVDWSKRIKDQMEKAKAEAEKSKNEVDKDRKPDTKPSHALEDYAGDYENPGYGTISIIKDGERLKVKLNSLEGALTHYHYDTFELLNPLYDMKQKLSFGTDPKGNIGSLSIPLEPTVKDIVFTRAPEKAMMERSFLEKFAGQYENQGVIVTFSLKGEKTLVATVPGQPEYELVPYKGTEFNLKGVAGLSVEFNLDDAGKPVAATLKQPGATTVFKRK